MGSGLTEDAVYFSPAMNGWIVTGYAEACAALRHPALTIGLPPRLDVDDVDDVLAPILPALRSVAAHEAGIRHRRVRRTVLQAFSHQPVQELRPMIAAQTRRRLADAAASGGQMELLATVVEPVVKCVAAAAVGVPTDDAASLDALTQRVSKIGQFGTRRWSSAVAADIAGAWEQLTDLVRALLERPQGPSGLLGCLATDGKFAEDQVIAQVVNLYGTGLFTTSHMVLAAVYFLFRDPELLSQVRGQQVSAASVVQETLRFAPPTIETAIRVAAEDLTLADQRIRRGDLVRTFLVRANRDPRKFASANSFDPRREASPHLSFGAGSHRCPGAGLATAAAEEICHAVIDSGYDMTVATPLPRLQRSQSSPLFWGFDQLNMTIHAHQ